MNNNRVSRGKHIMKRQRIIVTYKRMGTIKEAPCGRNPLHCMLERLWLNKGRGSQSSLKLQRGRVSCILQNTNNPLPNFIVNATPTIKRNNVKIFDFDGIKSNKNKRRRRDSIGTLEEDGQNLESPYGLCDCYYDVVERQDVPYKNLLTTSEKNLLSWTGTRTKIHVNCQTVEWQRPYYHVYDLIGIQSPKHCFTLRDKALYTIYRTYNMMDLLLYSTFYNKMRDFNFINILFGFKLFRSYLSCSSVGRRNVDLIFLVSSVIASKFLDDKNVINEWISDELWLINQLEIEILSTVGYTIEINLGDVNDLMVELFGWEGGRNMRCG